MLEEKALFPETSFPVAYVGGGDGSMVLDHEIVFVSRVVAGKCKYRVTIFCSLGWWRYEFPN